MSDVAWFCNRCTTKEGSRFENRGFRKECLICKRSKGVAHFGDVPPKSPAKKVGKDKGGKPGGGEGAAQDKGGAGKTARRNKELEAEVRREAERSAQVVGHLLADGRALTQTEGANMRVGPQLVASKHKRTPLEN